MSLTLIADNLVKVQQNIAEAARKSGRSADDVSLVGVCKYFDADITRLVAEAGLLDLGENRPQQLWDKAAMLEQLPIRWHQIGHLQRNKVRRTLPLIHLFHAADSLRLLKEINKEADRINTKQDVLLEVNVSGEEAKHGFAPQEMESVLEQCAKLTSVRVRGLMAMAGLNSGIDGAAADFASLRELQQRLLAFKPENVELGELSMGMSRDYDIAIEHGATIVRVGSSLFEGLSRR
ncbi:MAG: YggS family pyridoxal phosphate-dependent enzyme [Planctomycetaceae bacterium]|nr:YggS family pyridoxal phosphate-dependent enzyme [Planctomycetaceae bacterium]|tara:strand:- start:261 stop:965 length:705 start_codon:yes stop_codon:yes gene_type:complete